MTNPIAKAIAKIGVAMGYGQLEDYKGSSVEDMLESFASIAQEKGAPSGGNDFYVLMEMSSDAPSRIAIPFSDVKNALTARKNVYLFTETDKIFVKLPALGWVTMPGGTRIFVDGTVLDNKVYMILQDGSIISTT